MAPGSEGGLPPLPAPPPAAVAYLHQRYLPSLPHPRHHDFADLPDYAADDDDLPPAVARALQGYRARRAIERAKRLHEVGNSEDEWEDEAVAGGAVGGRHSATKHLIVLSRHPALAKVRSRPLPQSFEPTLILFSRAPFEAARVSLSPSDTDQSTGARMSSSNECLSRAGSA